MKKQTILVSLFFVIVFALVMFLLYGNNDNNSVTINKTQYSLSGSALNLDSVGVTDKEIKLISKKINSSQSIEVLYLGGNNITKNGLAYLSSINNNKINVIDLSNNKIGDDGMKDFLEKNLFKVVDISGNNLSDISVENFINNSKTTYLTINRNNIKDSGFELILKNSNLEYLSIESNSLTDKSIDYLLNYSGSNLKYVRLKGNNFSQDGLKKLLDLKEKKVFKTLEY